VDFAEIVTSLKGAFHHWPDGPELPHERCRSLSDECFQGGRRLFFRQRWAVPTDNGRVMSILDKDPEIPQYAPHILRFSLKRPKLPPKTPSKTWVDPDVPQRTPFQCIRAGLDRATKKQKTPVEEHKGVADVGAGFCGLTALSSQT
jgi:hypothetical protein